MRRQAIVGVLGAVAFGTHAWGQAAQSGVAPLSRDQGMYEAPVPESAPAPGLSDEVRERVARAVVMIERIDRDGKQMGSACGFIDSRGLVITNRHCVEGSTAVKLNLGAAGMFDLPTVLSESRDLDVVALKGEFPLPAGGGLEWASTTPHVQAPLTVVTRDRMGQVVTSPGWCLGFDFSADGLVVLATSCPAWLGCSGSPVVDREGRVVGVVSRLGSPTEGQRRTTAQAAPSGDVRALAVDVPVAMADWDVDDKGNEWKRYRAWLRAGERYADFDPKRAESYLREALQQRPNDLRATYTLSGVLKQLGRKEEATELLKKLATNRPEDPLPQLYLGHRMYWERDWAGAILGYRASLAARATAVGWFWLATAYWMAGDKNSAASGYEQVVRLEPRHTRSWDSLSMLYRAMGRHDEEIRVFKQRLELEPEDAELLRSLAEAYLASGRKEEHHTVTARLSGINPYLANRAGIPASDQPDDERK